MCSTCTLYVLCILHYIELFYLCNAMVCILCCNIALYLHPDVSAIALYCSMHVTFKTRLIFLFRFLLVLCIAITVIRISKFKPKLAQTSQAATLRVHIHVRVYYGESGQH